MSLESLPGFPGTGTIVLPADQARPFTMHEIAAPKLRRIEKRGNVDGWMAKYSDELRAVVDAPDRALTPDDLVYAATVRCRCGAGLSYPRLDKDPHGQWICSAVYLGAAEGSEHGAAKPFTFWSVKGEGQPSANGATTRPGGIVPASELPPAPRAPHEQRVLDERTDLAAKLSKLTAFLQTPAFAALSLVDQGLLAQQAVHMEAYLGVLDQRVKRFAP